MKEPRLRLKEFVDNWKVIKLSEIARRVTRKNSHLESTLPLTISAAEGLISQISFFNNIVASSNLSGYYLIKKGEFAYNKSSSAGHPFGSIKRLNKYEEGALSTLYIVFNISGDVSSDYVTYFFDTSLWYKEVAMRAFEGARNHGLLNIGANDFLDINISLPADKREQQAIADFFKSLDSMITLTSKKIEKLKQTLTGCMQTMFPQEGEFEPKIRFKGFEGEWKVLRIGDISKNIKRIVPNSNAPIMMITAQNGFINQSDRYSFNNAGESLKKYIELRKRELAYNHGASKLRPYGSCFALNVEKARVPFVYHCFTVNDNSDPEFISLVLNNAGVNDQLRKIITSGARMDGLLNISFEEYCSLILQLPSLEEQQRIVTYFNSFNEMISLQSKRLDLLKHIKSACLDNMFV